MAIQLARWGGATVIGTVRHRADLEHAHSRGVEQIVALDGSDHAREIRDHAPGGIDRIIEVAFSDNIDLDAAVAKNNTVIAAYGTGEGRPSPVLADAVRQHHHSLAG